MDVVRSKDGYGTSRRRQRPTLGLQLLINCILHSCDKEGVRSLNLAPGIRLVLREVCRVVVVRLHVTSEGRCRAHQGCGQNCCLYVAFHGSSFIVEIVLGYVVGLFYDVPPTSKAKISSELSEKI